MRIGELAKRGRVPAETIRYYEKMALLPQPPRTASGYRAYGPEHLQRLVFLRRARELGFSIREVRELLQLARHPEQPCRNVNRLATAHLVAVRDKLRELNRLKRALDDLVESCRCEASVAECGILAALADAPDGRRVAGRRAARLLPRTG